MVSQWHRRNVGRAQLTLGVAVCRAPPHRVEELPVTKPLLLGAHALESPIEPCEGLPALWVVWQRWR